VLTHRPRIHRRPLSPLQPHCMGPARCLGCKDRNHCWSSLSPPRQQPGRSLPPPRPRLPPSSRLLQSSKRPHSHLLSRREVGSTAEAPRPQWPTQVPCSSLESVLLIAKALSASRSLFEGGGIELQEGAEVKIQVSPWPEASLFSLWSVWSPLSRRSRHSWRQSSCMRALQVSNTPL